MTETELLHWLVYNQDRYERINKKRDAGESVASHDKEFVAKYERNKRAVAAKARGEQS